VSRRKNPWTLGLMMTAGECRATGLHVDERVPDRARLNYDSTVCLRETTDIVGDETVVTTRDAGFSWRWDETGVGRVALEKVAKMSRALRGGA